MPNPRCQVHDAKSTMQSPRCQIHDAKSTMPNPRCQMKRHSRRAHSNARAPTHRWMGVYEDNTNAKRCTRTTTRRISDIDQTQRCGHVVRSLGASTTGPIFHNQCNRAHQITWSQWNLNTNRHTSRDQPKPSISVWRQMLHSPSKRPIYGRLPKKFTATSDFGTNHANGQVSD